MDVTSWLWGRSLGTVLGSSALSRRRCESRCGKSSWKIDRSCLSNCTQRIAAMKRRLFRQVTTGFSSRQLCKHMRRSHRRRRVAPCDWFGPAGGVCIMHYLSALTHCFVTVSEFRSQQRNKLFYIRPHNDTIYRPSKTKIKNIHETCFDPWKCVGYKRERDMVKCGARLYRTAGKLHNNVRK